ncbi:MAG: imelysin [Bacteroidaceae bacterium]|nr:imelysin [Bacteroidaceae bacterium]
MKKRLTYVLMLALASVGFVACEPKEEINDEQYADRTYGNEAVASCEELINQLNAATEKILKSRLTEAQEAGLRAAVKNDVEKVIVPMYTKLADAAVKLQQALGDLSAKEIKQSDIDAACNAFKEARAWWEKSEAFLGGAASDFDIDPTIDSWPLNRDMLLSYFKSGTYSDEALEDASILGFHALEFVLFREGKNRTVAEFQTNDTYKGFTAVPAAEELKYAQAVAKELVTRCCQLQVSWELTPDTKRLDAVAKAELEYQTKNGKSFGWNMMNAGAVGSTFSSLADAIQQLLNDDEGSCAAIADEVGSGKIGNPFGSGYIFYVESPYSYNSITDFQNNIRSIENVWYGSTDGSKSPAKSSLHQWFKDNDSDTGRAVELAIDKAISKIGAMPAPFVKYVSTIWNKSFEDDKVVDIE